MKTSVKKSALRNRQLRIESLEARQLLSVNPLGIDNSAPAAVAPPKPIALAAAPANTNAADLAVYTNLINRGLTDDNFSWINIGGTDYLSYIYAGNKGLTGSLDVSGCTNLRELDCRYNNLTTVYVPIGFKNAGTYSKDNNTELVEGAAPAKPTLTKGAVTATSVTLFWTGVGGDGIVGFQYKAQNGSWVADNLTFDGTSVTVTGLTANTTYQFRLWAAVDGPNSENDATLEVKTLADTPLTKPTAPGNLTAKVLPMSNGKLPVQINWNAASNATHYILHRWEEGDYKADGKTKNWKVIYAMKPAEQIPSGGAVSTFQVINSDVSKVTAKQVQYLVRGYNGDVPGESANIFVTLNSTPVIPTAPKNLTAKVLPMSNGKLPVQINWNAAAGATHYILHRWEEGDYKADGKTKNWKVIYAMKPAGQIPSGGLLSDFQVINSDVSKVTAKQVQYLVRGYNGDIPGESASVFVTVN